MTKPIKQIKEYYDLLDCLKFIDEKYNLYYSAEGVWDYLADTYITSNGCEFSFYYMYGDGAVAVSEQVRNYLDLFYKEFDVSKDTIFYVSW